MPSSKMLILIWKLRTQITYQGNQIHIGFQCLRYLEALKELADSLEKVGSYSKRTERAALLLKLSTRISRGLSEKIQKIHGILDT